MRLQPEPPRNRPQVDIEMPEKKPQVAMKEMPLFADEISDIVLQARRMLRRSVVLSLFHIYICTYIHICIYICI